MTTLGPLSLLDLPANGFLCSSKARSTAILPCLDWAARMAKGTEPVMSTFHSELECAVLDILLQGSCPIILVLGRSLYKEIPEKLRPAFEAGRLLILSLCDQKRITRDSARACNEYICKNAHSLTFGFLSPESSLFQLCQEAQATGKVAYIIEQ